VNKRNPTFMKIMHMRKGPMVIIGYDKHEDDTIIVEIGTMEKKATLEVVDASIKVAKEKMEKHLVEIHILSNDLIIYQCASVESNIEAAKDGNEIGGHMEEMPRLLLMSISKRKGIKYEDEADGENKILNFGEVEK